MHGLIFVSFRDYVATAHGTAAEEKLMAGEPVYLLSEAYPDERFAALVERTCQLTGLPRDELLHDFGAFTAEKTFARLYPALFDVSGSTRAFLLAVETPIHEVVRVAIPEAVPPRLQVSEIGEHGVSIVYTSPRGLCAMSVASSKVQPATTGRPCTSRNEPACIGATKPAPSSFCSRTWRRTRAPAFRRRRADATFPALDHR